MAKSTADFYSSMYVCMCACVYRIVLCGYTLAPEIKFTSLRIDEHVQLLLYWLWVEKQKSLAWHIEMLRYIRLTLVKLCKEGAEKSFFRDAKHEDAFFLINQAHSISISLPEQREENFFIIWLALNRTSIWTEARKNVTNFGRFTFQVSSYILNGKFLFSFFFFGIRKVLNLLDYFGKICPFWHNISAQIPIILRKGRNELQ